MDETCIVYFNSILFEASGAVFFNVDIVHPKAGTRLNMLFRFNVLTRDEETTRIINLLLMGNIEGQNTIQVKFMSSDVRELPPIQMIMRYLMGKFEPVSDNTIIMKIKKKEVGV